MFKIFLVFLALIVAGKILLIFSRKHQRKIDNFNENILADNKKKVEFFKGQPKPKSVWSEMYDIENRVN